MAGQPRPIGGAASMKIGGRQMALRGSFKYSGQTKVSTTVFGQDGTLHGTTTKPRAPFVEAEFSHVDVTVQDYQAINGDTIIVDLDNGKTLTLTNAVVVGEIDIDHEEGKTTLRLEGDRLDEV